MALMKTIAIATLLSSMMTSVESQTTTETSSITTSTESSTVTSTESSSIMTSTESSTITSTESSTVTSTESTSTQTSTTVPGPFFVTQSVVVFSNGTQEEVESLVLGALDFVIAETARMVIEEIAGQSSVENCTQDSHCPIGNRCSQELAICFPPYMLRTSDRCPRYIRTMDECSTAADILGLSDTSPRDDNERAASYDPPFCYFEDGSLKFNRGGNLGYCNQYDECLCATTDQGLSYGNLTAATTALSLRSSGGEDLGGLVGGFRGDLPGTFNVVNFFNAIRRLTAASSGYWWRVDAELEVHDRFTSELLFEALGNLGVVGVETAERADFLDAIRAQTEGSSLLISEFMFSDPQVLRPTQTITQTRTATSATATTTETSLTASSATTSKKPAGGLSAPPVEDSTALIVAIAGDLVVVLAVAVAAAVLVLRRRKAGSAAQFSNEEDNSRDVERATTSNSRYSDNVMEI